MFCKHCNKLLQKRWFGFFAEFRVAGIFFCGVLCVVEYFAQHKEILIEASGEMK